MAFLPHINLSHRFHGQCHLSLACLTAVLTSLCAQLCQLPCCPLAMFWTWDRYEADQARRALSLLLPTKDPVVLLTSWMVQVREKSACSRRKSQ